jgi:hypothetical protein
VASVLDRLGEHGLPERVVIGDALRELLGGLTIASSQVEGQAETGSCEVGAIVGRPLGVFDLELTLPLPPVPFRLELDGGPQPSGFHLWLHLSEAEPAQPIFGFLQNADYALAGAKVERAGEEEWLEASGEPVRLQGLALSLLVRGSAGEPAVALLTPTQGGPDGIVSLQAQPATVLVGGTSFGLDLAEGLALDASSTAAAPGTTEIAGEAVTLAADTPSWQGILIRKARLFLPRGVPLLGGHAIETFLAVGSDPPGIDFSLATEIPARGERPRIGVRIECRDPTARGLAGFVPTLVEGEMDLPLEGEEGFAGNSIEVLAGTPVTARVSLAREPTAVPPTTRVTLAVEAQGDRGILTIDAGQGGLGERATVAAGALATALVADGAAPSQPAPDGDGSGVYLHLLLTAAVGLSAFLRQKGRVVLHSVELEAEGPGAELADKLALKLDYSVDAVVDSFGVGVMSVGMREDQPLRVRVREVVLSIDRSKSGLEQFHLGFDRATLEVEDPGGWKVEGPGSLFDVLGTRSGRGSMWIEVDLRFKLDLGPVKVEGATIRGTLDADGHLSAELRGLAASLQVPGLIDGEGQVAIEQAGFKAALDVEVTPLNVRADAFVKVAPPRVDLGLGIDLPGAIPLANSGLGIYGLGGAFSANGKPKLPTAPGKTDLISRQLAWNHKSDGFETVPGATTIGVEAVIGTVPDLGFAFSAKAGLFLTVPDFAIRVGLDGKVMSPRLKITDRPEDEVGFGPRFRGVVVIDPADGVTIGLLGTYRVPFLLDAQLPLGAHFPVAGNDWFIYLGADGYPKQERALGPIQVELLPDLVGTRGGGFLMMRGHGIKEFGRGSPRITVDDGFILAFGFGFEYVLGVKGVIWAEIHAGADFLLATNPMLFAGFGNVGGSLNLGPVSIGVDANLQFLLGEGQDPYLHAEVCGHVDLFFFELEGCVEIEVGSTPAKAVPLPSEHPLDRKEGGETVANAALIDHTYRQVGPLAADPGAAATVWPDTLLHLAFATPPKLGANVGGAQLPSVRSTYGARARAVGSDMLSYQWTLTKLELRDVTGDEHGEGTLVAGELSAAWLPGKSGDVGQAAEPAELALLTPRGDLWLRRTADGGRGLGHDPLGDLAHSCEAAAPARIGWTLGWDAAPSGPDRRLVPSVRSADPTVSQLSGTATGRCSVLGDIPLSPAAARRLPLGFELERSRQVAFESEMELDDDLRPWPGYLSLDDVFAPLREGPLDEYRYELHQSWTIELEDEIDSGRIWLVIDDGDDTDVDDELGGDWSLSDEIKLADGRIAARYDCPHGDSVRRVTVSWRLSPRPGFLALGGITRRAREAAEARENARRAQGEQQATAAEEGPQEHQESSASRPTVLAPGRTYRLDLDLSWEGELKTRDEHGVETTTPGNGSTYLPAGAPEPLAGARSYWFRTAKPAQPASSPDGTLLPLMAAVPKFGEAELFTFLKSKRDVFHPAMLERHFLGYEPGQTEGARFCDDPLRAHFGADHVGMLADAYGFELKLGVRRTDVPGTEGDPQLPIAVLVPLLAPWLLDTVGRRWEELALAGPCAVPVPGATLQATPALEPEAWYELHVLAKSKSDSILDGRLPPVSFHTSRWRNPSELLAELGFALAGTGTHSGDLEMHADGATVGLLTEGSDAGFEAGLVALGLESLPAPTGSRVSLLWQPAADGKWLLAGVLIEAPEPVLRPGRLDFDRLSFGFGGDDPSRLLDLRRRDRTGSRLLFLAREPISLGPVSPLLNLHLVDRMSGAPIQGRLRVPPFPSFAWEPR